MFCKGRFVINICRQLVDETRARTGSVIFGPSLPLSTPDPSVRGHVSTFFSLPPSYYARFLLL